MSGGEEPRRRQGLARVAKRLGITGSEFEKNPVGLGAVLAVLLMIVVQL
jgi:hypothetical protein